jgi:hypothetical protein
MYSQFSLSEGKKLSLLVGGIVVSSGHDISHNVNSLKKMRNCRQIKSAYRRFALEHHPDQNGSDSEFIKLTEAKEKALESCSNSAKIPEVKSSTKTTNGKSRGQKHGTTSSKKRAKRNRRNAKKHKKKSETESSSQSDIKSVIGSVGALCVGIEYIRRHKSHPRRHKSHRLLRQCSNEDYEHATGHKRRYKT